MNPLFHKKFGQYDIEVSVLNSKAFCFCIGNYTTESLDEKQLTEIYCKTNEAKNCYVLLNSWVKAYNRGDKSLDELKKDIEEYEA